MAKQIKKFVAQHGAIELGRSAIVQLNDGSWVQTSPVTDNTKWYYRFETENTVYMRG